MVRSPARSKTKKTKKGEREYVYYRCARYHRGGHPRIRVTEAELDEQMLALFDRLRVESDEFREGFGKALRQMTNWDLGGIRKRCDELKQRHTQVVEQQDRLLNLRLLEEIDS